jgi:hypothetical protein
MTKPEESRFNYNIKIPTDATPEEIKEFMNKFMEERRNKPNQWRIEPDSNEQSSKPEQD